MPATDAATAPPPVDRRATPISKGIDRALCLVSAIALLAIFAYLLLQNLHRIRDQNRLSDFRHFYGAAEAMRQHRNPYLSWKGGYVYPPLLAFLYMPLTRWPIEHAAQVAEVVDVAAIFGGLVLSCLAVLRRLSPSTPARGVWPVALVVALVMLDKIKGETQMLQTDVYIVLAVGAALYWLDRWPVLAGLALALVGLVALIAGFDLPPSKWARAHDVWFFWGGPAWCLMFMLAMTLWTSLRQVRAMTSAPTTAAQLDAP